MQKARQAGKEAAEAKRQKSDAYFFYNYLVPDTWVAHGYAGKAEPFDNLSPATVYQIGCAHAQLSRNRTSSQDEAITFLARAIRRGYGLDLLDSDSDLDPIRGLEEFRTLCKVAEL